MWAGGDYGRPGSVVVAGAGTAFEKMRSAIAAVVTALVLIHWGPSFWGPSRKTFLLTPIYLYPLIAGIVGYLAGRSRRGAFFAAVTAVLALDIGQLVYLLQSGVRGNRSFRRSRGL